MLDAASQSTSQVLDPTIYRKSHWYLGREGLKAEGVPTEWTMEMVEEAKRCAADLPYFCDKYVWIIDVDEGLVKFKARPYQEEFWRRIQKNRFVIGRMGRQSGKTTSVVGFLLHYAIFNKNMNVGVAAQNLGQAKEILHRFKLAYEYLPPWLQVGVAEWQKESVTLGNGTRLFASSSNGDALRGKSLSVLVLDEFAHLRNDKEFMTSTWPVVSSGKKTRIVIISTPNGVGNAFFQLWNESEKGKNDFNTLHVKWDEIPGRDAKWREKQEKEIGKRRFAQEYAAEFMGSSNTLIPAEDIVKMEEAAPDEPLYITDDQYEVSVFEEPEVGYKYVMTCDVGRGYGGDYSTFTVWKLGAEEYTTVATFASNEISPNLYPHLIAKWGNYYNEAFVVVERNDAGGEVANTLYYSIEYENMYCDRSGSKFKPGFWTSTKTKREGCTNLRDLMDVGKINILDKKMIEEMKTFEGNTSGIYNATKGNFDDRIQNAWLLGAVMNSSYYQNFNEGSSVAEVAHSDAISKLRNEMPPIGSMNGKQMSERAKSRMMDRLFDPNVSHDQFNLVIG